MKNATILKDRVSEKLKQSKSCQQSDTKLLRSIWFEDLVSHGVDKRTAAKVARAMTSDKVTHPESVTRTRRLLQNKDPQTYGLNVKRKKREEEIKNLVKNA